MTLAAALPAPAAPSELSEIPSVPELRPRILTEDDMILVGNGRHQVIKKRDYEALRTRSVGMNNTIRSTPTWSNATIGVTKKIPRELSERGCEESSEVQINDPTHFSNWDVAMSSVVTAEHAVASVSVTQGFSLSNSLSVSAGVEVSTVEKLVSASLSVSYSVQWTTSDSIAYTFVVAAGKSGLVVSNPETTRYTGTYIYGCTDSPSTADWTSDTYTSATMDGLEWVEGKIQLCTSDSYPVAYCVGTGDHY
ncbi:hypothetical protein K490DRAFT_36431 [Saccharata proteae CBS 121410]|uniref:Uncharacterized protein n=1 Tax=Saccharata proteae CBS 121410 TaxID=1314787 RepID=A0A9P4HZG3_9PEZI|nr:hypothetical protein K490DRAFT_36431 [Saccharata proteae CBS 121410]